MLFFLGQIEDGDIICFQKRLSPESEQQVRFPDVPSFLEYVKNRQVPSFTIDWISMLLQSRAFSFSSFFLNVKLFFIGKISYNLKT